MQDVVVEQIRSVAQQLPQQVLSEATERGPFKEALLPRAGDPIIYSFNSWNLLNWLSRRNYGSKERTIRINWDEAHELVANWQDNIEIYQKSFDLATHALAIALYTILNPAAKEANDNKNLQPICGDCGNCYEYGKTFPAQHGRIEYSATDSFDSFGWAKSVQTFKEEARIRENKRVAAV